MVITIPIEKNPGTSAQTVVSIGLRNGVHLYGSEHKNAPFQGCCIQVAAVAELLGLIQRQGIELGRALEILSATPLLSPAANGAATLMQSGDFSPLFPTELVEKGLGYASHAAAQCDSDVPLIEATRTVFANALSRGMGAENLTGLVRLYRPKRGMLT